MRTIYKLFFSTLLIGLIIPTNSFAQIKLDVGGYIQNWVILDQQTERLLADDTVLEESTTGFRVRRARLTARGNINETFSSTIWLEFAGNTNHLLDFHVDAHLYPWLNIRAGQFIMPGQTHDTARLVSSRLAFYERPSVTTRLASLMGYDAFRDIGIMAYGTIGNLWYGIHAGNGSGRFTQAGSNITNRDRFGGLYGARVDYRLVDGLTIGGHFSYNTQKNVVASGREPYDRDRVSYSGRIATDGFLIDNLFTQFEYAVVSAKDDVEVDIHGYYAEAGYRITKDWHVLGRIDERIEKPDSDPRFDVRQFTFAVTRYLWSDGKEIGRLSLNYAFSDPNPGNLNNSALVAVLQFRFIP